MPGHSWSRLQLLLVEEGIPLTGRKSAKAPAKPKKNEHTDAAMLSSKARKKFGKKGRRR